MEICLYLKLKEEKIAAILPCEQRLLYYICTGIYSNIIGPLQLAILEVQNRHAGTQKSH